MKHILPACLLLFSFVLSAQNTYNAPVMGDLAIEDCFGVLYDSGGENGPYTIDNSASVTLTGTSGNALALTFTAFDLESNFDELAIYDGPNSSSPLIGVYDGTSLPNDGEPIILSGLTGTIVFDSDGSVNRDGFALEFSCLDFTEPPVADAAFSNLSCTGTVAFSDASTFFPTSWAWDFGDGNTSTEENPVHTYASSGTYDIELIVCNDNGCDTTFASQAITFDPESFACTNGFTMSYQGADTTMLCNGIIYDNGGPTGDYQEGSFDQFIIAPPGATSITLTFLAFDLGSTTNNHDQLYIFDFSGANPNILANYSGSALPNNGQPITFNVSSLNVYFSSDHFNNFSGFEIIWEANGSTSPPVAAITAETTNVPFGTAVQFTDASTGNPGGWLWDFGDGTTSNEQNPSHVYTQSGTFNVSLSVTNCSGSDASAPLTVTVQESPSVTYDPESFLVTVSAGTSTTEILNLCNVGSGDLLSTISTLGNGPQVGYVFEFTTSAEVAGLRWEILNVDFEVVAASDLEYAANTTYTEVISGLEPGGQYFFSVYNDGDSGVFDSIILSDLGTGEIYFSGFFAFNPEQIYTFPSPLEGPEGVVTWLDIADNTNPLAPDACEALTVTFDATDLIDGSYEGAIVIATNDPNNPLINIPVTLVVIGTPELAISANDLDFGEVQLGGSATLSFDLENTGTAAVSVSGLLSGNSSFTVQGNDELLVEPYQSTTVEVVFAPEAVAAFSETLTLVNNAGDDVLVNLTGTGIAAPSLTLTPTEFTIELISGEDTTLVADIGNVGEAVLTYDISPFSNSTGFIFNFTTDQFGYEFSWNLLNSSGQVVQSSNGTQYLSNTDYSVELNGLSSAETYTLLLLDSWGDGALPAYSVVDALSGQVVASGTFVGNLSEVIVPVGRPATEFSSISPTSGTLQVNENNELLIDVDATGLATGVYFLSFEVNTNDPLQPTATIIVNLFVIAPVTAAINAPELVCGELAVPFIDASTNVPTSWAWDFGDGTASTEQNPTHTYTQDGVYTVSLIACNSLGCDTVELVDYIVVDLGCYTENIPAHGNELVTVCEGTIYDSGGPDGDYLEGSFGSITIAPPGASMVSVTFSEFNYQEHDFVYVYDGDLLTGTLLGIFTENDLQGQTLVAESGVLTIREQTDHFTNLSGFVATFFCDSNPTLPVPDFSVVNTSVCENEQVAFVDESLDSPDSWFWEFGDGGTSNEQNPFYVYNVSGTYTVTLTVCNDMGCNTLMEDVTIIIDRDCVVEDIPLNKEEFIFGCSGTIYDSGGATGNYLNNNTGSLTIFSTGGSITLDFIALDLAPFDSLIIYDGATTAAPIRGAFSGNTLPESITSTGDVITIVEITNLTGNESGYQINYTCQGVQPLARGMIITNDEICDGNRSFAADTDADLDSWSWDFGDGHTSTEPNPEHEFAHSGAYEISLVICQGSNCESMQTMIYSNKLTPVITAPDTVALGQEVELQGLTAAATHWSWDFGNGETADHNSPVTTYQEAGWHDIHVHLTNMNVGEACDATHVHPIYVDAGITSVNESELIPFSVFPNPTTGQVNLQGLEGLTGDQTVRIVNAMGQVIKTVTLNTTISIAEFPAGMYTLEVIDGKELLGRSRLIKQ